MADKASIVGRVAVKVLPDTDDFAGELRKALNRIESSTDAIDVDVEANTAKLREDIRDALRVIQATIQDLEVDIDLKGREQVRVIAKQIQEDLDGIEDRTVHVDLDESGRKEIENTINAMDDLIRKQDELADRYKHLNNAMQGAWGDDALSEGAIAAAREQAKALADDIEDLKKNLSIDLSVDLNEVSVRKLRHDLEQIKDKYDNQELNYEPVIDGVNQKLTWARLTTLGRDRWVKYKPLVDGKAMKAVATQLAALSGARLLKATFKNAWDLVEDLDKDLPIISLFTTGLIALSAWAAAAASNLLSLGLSLARILGASLVLPGIFGGMAFGIGASIAVLKDFNKVVPEVKAELSALQDVMSSAFWATAAAPIRESLLSIIAIAGPELTKTASTLGSFFAEVAQEAEKHIGKSMPEMFDNLNTAILISVRGVEHWVQVFEVLGRRGSEYLPRLAAWANDLGLAWHNWLDEAESTGKLDAMIETGIVNLKHLWTVMVTGIGILGDLGRAAEAAGGSTLESLATKLIRIREITSGENFQDGLTRALMASHDAMELISNKSGPRVTAFFENLVDTMERSLPDVGAAVGEIIGGIAEALSTDTFSKGVLDLLAGIRKAVDDFAPTWKVLGDGIGELLSLVGSLAEKFGPVLTGAINLLSDAAGRLRPYLEGIAEVLSGRLLFYLDVVGPAVLVLAEAFSALMLGLASVPGLLEAVVVAVVGLKVATLVAAAMGALNTGMATATAVAPKAATALRLVWTALGGWPLVVGGALLAIGGLFSALKDPPKMPDLGVEDMAAQLSDFRDGAIGATAELKMLFSEVNKSNPGINTMSKWSDAVDVMGASMKQAFGDDMIDRWNRFSSWTDQVAFDDFAARAAVLDDAMAEMVNSGNAADAEAMWRDLAAAAVEGNVSLGEWTAGFPKYTSAQDTAVESASKATELYLRETEATLGLTAGTLESAESLAVYNRALASVGDITPAVISSIREASKAFVDLKKGLNPADWGDGKVFSLETYLSDQEQSVRDMEVWADNMAKLAGRVSTEALAALTSLGVEGVPLVAALANGSQAEIDRFEEIVRAGAAGAVNGATGELGKLAAQALTAMKLAEAVVDGELSRWELVGLMGGRGFAAAIPAGMLEGNPALAEAVALITAALDGDLDALGRLGTPEGQALVQNVIAAMNGQLPTAEQNAAAGAGGIAVAFGGGLKSDAALVPAGAAGTTLVGEMLAKAKIAEATGVIQAGEFGRLLGTSFGSGTNEAGLSGLAIMNALTAPLSPTIPVATAGTTGTSIGTQFGITGAPAATTSANSIMAALNAGLIPEVPVATASGIGTDTGETFGIGGAIGARSSGVAIMAALNAGLIPGGKAAIKAAGGVGTDSAAAIGKAAPLFGAAGKEQVKQYSAMMSAAVHVAQSAASAIGSAAITSLKSSSFGASAAGTAVGAGFASGISAMRGSVAGAAASLGAAATAAFKANLKIQSPSKVFEGFGEMTALGFIEGLDGMHASVEEAAERVAEAASKGMTKRPITAKFAAGDLAFGEGSTSGGQPADVYVQNPWTGEYMLAQQAGVARGVFADELVEARRATRRR